MSIVIGDKIFKDATDEIVVSVPPKVETLSTSLLPGVVFIPADGTLPAGAETYTVDGEQYWKVQCINGPALTQEFLDENPLHHFEFESKASSRYCYKKEYTSESIDGSIGGKCYWAFHFHSLVGVSARLVNSSGKYYLEATYKLSLNPKDDFVIKAESEKAYTVDSWGSANIGMTISTYVTKKGYDVKLTEIDVVKGSERKKVWPSTTHTERIEYSTYWGDQDRAWTCAFGTSDDSKVIRVVESGTAQYGGKRNQMYRGMSFSFNWNNRTVTRTQPVSGGMNYNNRYIIGYVVYELED